MTTYRMSQALYNELLRSAGARYADWYRANWERWVGAGSYLTDEPKPVPAPCRAIVVYKQPVAVPPVVTPDVIYLPAPLTVSLWHPALAA